MQPFRDKLRSGPARCRSGLYIATVLSFSGLVFGSVALAPGLSTSSRALAMGTLGAVCGVVMYAAPIAQLRVALATFDPGAIPLLLVVVSASASVASTESSTTPPPAGRHSHIRMLGHLRAAC